MDKLNELVAAINTLSGKIDGFIAKYNAAVSAAGSLPPTAVDGGALQPAIDALNTAAAKIPA